MKSFKNLSKFKRILIICAIVLFLVFSIVKTYFPQIGLTSWKNDINSVAFEKLNEADEKDLTVYFLDVGQGDCTLIKSINGNVLIDCGNSIDGDKISRFLLSHNVDSLDYLVITHPHSDHFGGAFRLLDFVEAKNVLMPEIVEEFYTDNEPFVRLVEKLNNDNVPFVAAKSGDRYELGDAVITVLSADVSQNEINDMSVVLRLDYGETSFLFMGDAEENVESKLINSEFILNCDILKVGHHGSSKGTSQAFLDAVKPSVAIISCGYDNEYGHPGEDVTYRLEKNRISYLRTDLNGTIVIGSDGEKLFCSFEKGKRF